ncbi:MAG: aminoacyl-tRNA hydrolase [Anaerolineales bacterium]|nr:aminoacyl-tRNA hydrolase [Anaerolineales bacterium]
MKIEITPDIHLDENEYTIAAFHAAGPGGQHVNKVATAVRLRFNIPSSSLPESVQRRLMAIAKNRISKTGDLTVTSRRFRTQERNRIAALQQLIDLIQQASIKPRRRRRTKPTKGSIELRLEQKRRHSAKKRGRSQAHDREA